ncbi:MAG: lipase family protein [Candidatus Nanopelagicales bacterium]
MAMSRSAAALGTAVVAVVAGGLLYVSAPASSLVDAPAFPKEESQAADLDATITPKLADFYDTPLGQTKTPGTLVSAQEVDGAPAGTKVFRILYSSTDLQGNAIPVTALYAVPDSAPPPGGFPLVGFAHGTTGVGRMCGISHTPFQAETPGYSAWVPHIEPLVKKGWAVVASDYSGMGAPGPSSYLVGPLEGRGILDSMRAVLQPSPDAGSVKIDAGKLGIYGKSQGGEAAMSALQLAPDYAPELDLGGGAILAPGFTPALQGVLNAVASNPTSTSQNMFVMLIAKSYAENYPDLVNLDDILSPEGRKRVALLDTMCGSELADAVSDIPLSQLINTPIATGLVTALAEGMPGNKPIPTPMIIVQGLKDKTILPQFTHAQVLTQCAWGSTVYYVRYPEDDHPSINFQARLNKPSVVDWMNARWADEPAPNNCANQLLGTAARATGVDG